MVPVFSVVLLRANFLLGKNELECGIKLKFGTELDLARDLDGTDGWLGFWERSWSMGKGFFF